MKRYWIGKDTPGSEVPPTSGEMVAVYLASDVDRLREEARDRVAGVLIAAGLHMRHVDIDGLTTNILAEVFKEAWEAIRDDNPVVEECYSQAAEEIRALLADNAKEGDPGLREKQLEVLELELKGIQTGPCNNAQYAYRRLHEIMSTARPAPAAPSDELIAQTLQRVEAEWNKTHAPDALLDDAMGLLHNHEQDHDAGWLADYEDVCSRYDLAPRKEGE